MPPQMAANADALRKVQARLVLHVDLGLVGREIEITMLLKLAYGAPGFECRFAAPRGDDGLPNNLALQLHHIFFADSHHQGLLWSRFLDKSLAKVVLKATLENGTAPQTVTFRRIGNRNVSPVL